MGYYTKYCLKDCPSGTYSRGGYNYKNETLIKLLNITDEEMIQLETIISRKEIKRRNNQQHKAKRRNENGLTKRQQEKLEKAQKIEELVRKGMKQKEIAKVLNISQQYVSKILKELQ